MDFKYAAEVKQEPDMEFHSDPLDEDGGDISDEHFHSNSDISFHEVDRKKQKTKGI